jgi:hypothetical protein
MMEPRRLLDQATGQDDELAALLGSARDDGPTAADRAAVAGAIGLGLAIGAMGVASHAAGAASAAGGSSASGVVAASAKSAAGKLGALAMLKLGGGVALVFGLGIATGVQVQKVRTPLGMSAIATMATLGPRTPAPAYAVAPATPSAPEPPVAPPADTVAIAPKTVASAPTTPAATAAATTTNTTAAPAPAASMLAQETALIERARKSVSTHAYADAIAALDAYDVLAPSGVLLQEARALRIQAYAEQGKRLAALDLGRAFLAEYPQSPYAKRVRAIVDSLDAPKNP